jgi:hypothetical protein
VPCRRAPRLRLWITAPDRTRWLQKACY